MGLNLYFRPCLCSHLGFVLQLVPDEAVGNSLGFYTEGHMLCPHTPPWLGLGELGLALWGHLLELAKQAAAMRLSQTWPQGAVLCGEIDLTAPSCFTLGEQPQEKYSWPHMVKDVTKNSSKAVFCGRPEVGVTR